VISDRPEQLPKQLFRICVTDEGIQIDFSDKQQEKADSPRQETLLPISKVTFPSRAQSRKQDSPTISTEAGMQIALNDLHWENAA
jgi:hypothetical protein